jgi:imidazolonepropionase-like amidohydrolase
MGDMSGAPSDLGCQIIDLKGQYVMPGLIDAHVHVMAAQVNLQDEALPDSYAHIRAARIRAARTMESMLQRGFTSIRDAGGYRFRPKNGAQQKIMLLLPSCRYPF